MKSEREKKYILFWLSFCRLFNAWKIVGMTMTCNRCDVMNIMWRKTEMEQKSDRKRWQSFYFRLVVQRTTRSSAAVEPQLSNPAPFRGCRLADLERSSCTKTPVSGSPGQAVSAVRTPTTKTREKLATRLMKNKLPRSFSRRSQPLSGTTNTASLY